RRHHRGDRSAHSLLDLGFTHWHLGTDRPPKAAREVGVSVSQSAAEKERGDKMRGFFTPSPPCHPVIRKLPEHAQLLQRALKLSCTGRSHFGSLYGEKSELTQPL